MLHPWFASRDLAPIRQQVVATGAFWDPYQTFSELLTEAPGCWAANTMFERVEHPGVGTYLMLGTRTVPPPA